MIWVIECKYICIWFRMDDKNHLKNKFYPQSLYLVGLCANYTIKGDNYYVDLGLILFCYISYPHVFYFTPYLGTDLLRFVHTNDAYSGHSLCCEGVLAQQYRCSSCEYSQRSVTMECTLLLVSQQHCTELMIIQQTVCTCYQIMLLK